MSAATLVSGNALPHIVQPMVGHSAVDVTMTICVDASLEEQRKALSMSCRGARRTRAAVKVLSLTPSPCRAADQRVLLICGSCGGQGRGRTADLPLFRRTLVPTELPGRTFSHDPIAAETQVSLCFQRPRRTLPERLDGCETRSSAHGLGVRSRSHDWVPRANPRSLGVASIGATKSGASCEESAHFSSWKTRERVSSLSTRRRPGAAARSSRQGPGRFSSGDSVVHATKTVIRDAR